MRGQMRQLLESPQAAGLCLMPALDILRRAEARDLPSARRDLGIKSRDVRSIRCRLRGRDQFGLSQLQAGVGARRAADAQVPCARHVLFGVVHGISRIAEEGC